jgi:hypothetical protein
MTDGSSAHSGRMPYLDTIWEIPTWLALIEHLCGPYMKSDTPTTTGATAS